jgi:hypothetical protein
LVKGRDPARERGTGGGAVADIVLVLFYHFQGFFFFFFLFLSFSFFSFWSEIPEGKRDGGPRRMEEVMAKWDTFKNATYEIQFSSANCFVLFELNARNVSNSPKKTSAEQWSTFFEKRVPGAVDSLIPKAGGDFSIFFLSKEVRDAFHKAVENVGPNSSPWKPSLSPMLHIGSRLDPSPRIPPNPPQHQLFHSHPRLPTKPKTNVHQRSPTVLPQPRRLPRRLPHCLPQPIPLNPLPLKKDPERGTRRRLH